MFSKRRFLSLILLLYLTCSTLGNILVYAAPEDELPWPEGPSVESEGAILIDANTGTILYEKNSDTMYYPASITKIMTALLTIENCDLDETVTFSKNAVFNIEPGSSHIAMNPGEELSVEHSLYGLLLASANEVANALAEHVSGSIEEFAVLMNKRAAELGATNTHFANANGLHDDNHYTTCHDMALIAKAAFDNPIFSKIDSTTYYLIPPTNLQSESTPLNMGHKMLKKSQSVYYEGILGGKTGWTSKANNTLVTCAERNGLKLIVVVLNSNQTHYADTKTLLDFGFANFKAVNIAENDTNFNINTSSRLDFLSLDESTAPLVALNKNECVVLPINADFSSLTSNISYDLENDNSSDALANISYYYGNIEVGSTTLDLTVKKSESFAFVQEETPEILEPIPEKEVVHINIWIIVGIIIALLVIILVLIWLIWGASPRNRRARQLRKTVKKRAKIHF